MKVLPECEPWNSETSAHVHQYDSAGRRDRQTLADSTYTTYGYDNDGMWVIQERNSSNTPYVGYTRGSDLSGSFEGAGGIGGLLAWSGSHVSGSFTNHLFYHADGGGNITYLVKLDQTAGAAYKYDAFGRTLSSSGSYASANVYRFSSKELHANTGFYYYGYRFYDPLTQRWPNRDPIDELGFLTTRALRGQAVPPWFFVLNAPNLQKSSFGHNCRFVLNDPVELADVFGLALLPETDALTCAQNCLTTKRCSTPGIGYFARHHALTSTLTGASGLLCAAAPNPWTCGAFVVIGIGEGIHWAHSLHKAQQLAEDAQYKYLKCLRRCAEKYQDWDTPPDFVGL